jgi:DnaJ like chaperone protein
MILLYARFSGSLKGYPGWLIAFFALLPVFVALYFFIFGNRHESKWEKGIFPENFKFNRDNLMEAYICLAALMIQKDKFNYNEKIQFLNSYFSKYFSNETYNFGDSLSFSFKHPIQLKTISYWLKKHLKETAKRAQVLYFLAGIAAVDGVFTKKEEALMKELASLLGLSEQDLNSILAQYTFETEAEYNERKNKRESENSSNNLNNSARIELAFQVLGLTSTASIHEIKSAYRKLAMVHHPDKFMNESPEQIKLAHERFQKILDAYELLEKMKG